MGMMPKEKAEELIHKFAKPIDALHKYPMCYETSKQCALIAVDEIISLMIKFHGRHIEDNISEIEYWQKVKQEIEKL